MVYLEWGLLIVIALNLILFLRKHANRKLVGLTLTSLSSLLLLIHLIWGEIRWQMYPVYLAVLVSWGLLFLVSYAAWNKTSVRRILFVADGLFLLIGIIASLVFPIYELPVPTGPSFVGTTSVVLEDSTRIEQYDGLGTEFRRVKLQFWYPADTIDGFKRAPWLEDSIDLSRALSKDYGLPFFVFDHTVNILSNSYIDAPLSTEQDTYPIVIISHGWRGFRNLHTDFAEELASQGYIVVAIDHTYGSLATVFDEDDIALVNLEALPDREDTPDFLDYANQLVDTYAGDITATLNYLETINDDASSSMFRTVLDLDNIGLLGHSTGGGAGAQVALRDNRIDAVFGLDSWVEPIVQTELDKGLSIPAVFIRSEAWETGYNNDYLYSLINSSSSNPTLYQIKGTTHYDFAMVYMYSPLVKVIGFSGEIQNDYLVEILETMMTDFFDQNLKQDGNGIDSSTWDEVQTITIP